MKKIVPCTIRFVMLIFVGILIVGGFAYPTPKSLAQFPTDVIYFCIDPTDPNNSSDDTYLVGFTEAVSLGIIPSQPASVTVYAPPQVNVYAAIYDVTPDAATGSFRQGASGGQVPTRPNTPSECGDAYADVLEDLINTIPLQVSIDPAEFNGPSPDGRPPALRTPTHRAVLVQKGDDSLLGERTTPFDGAAAFHFFSNDPGSLGDQAFQILQLTPGAVELTFPFLARAYVQETANNPFASTPFALLTNSKVIIQRSFTGHFLEQRISDAYPFYVEVLEGELGLPLKDIIQRRQFTVFPGWGLIENAPHLGFVRLNLSPADEPFNRAFEAGTRVAPLYAIADVEAKYYPLDRPITLDGGALGSLKGSDSTLLVVRVDEETGHLIVRAPNGADVVIQAWLVEVAKPE